MTASDVISALNKDNNNNNAFDIHVNIKQNGIKI